MIYLIQPPAYPKHIYHLLKENMEDLTIHQELQLIHQPPFISQENLNTYFIINDIERKDWLALATARLMRQNDPKSHIVLLTNEFDYTRFFRSHAAFLAIIDLNHPTEELKKLLTFLS
ncbi:hypothetical protein [Streptococcus saliviloxodontae]|uniref:Response regulator n=1 Tax=Streptococcus saliviloxodontae TaxID=1349416 RepID=A0ABS2PLY7_9STRE|nr:hypothetical protein [Streptococcus saliviloxodontae]MBM7636302.1 hypothetical protein [Streptococcus saliviloxodontae]